MDNSLEKFLGSDGLVLLLSHLEVGDLPVVEVVKMIQRLHIPNYEAARPFLKEAISAGVIEPNLPEGFHRQKDLVQVVEWSTNED